MLRIGLTGGIAAGKSAAAARFAELGARVVDHDVLARRAVEPGSAALSDIVRHFGEDVVVDGALDRGALGRLVFADTRARRKLNSIIHPYVFAMARAADRQAREDGAIVIVHDIPLLVETDQGGDFDEVVTVAAALPVRLKRLVEGRGMTTADALARIEAQADDEARAAVADVVIDGNGPLEQLNAQVDAFWRHHVPA